jgi:RNA polymerase sigma factor (TIGR02999 family)
MNEVTRVLSAMERCDPHAAEQLLPLVYDELRKLAAQKLANEKPGQTLQATALVHEAYLRLVGAEAEQQWESRGHFFAAAAEAMRRILVENARRKASLKRGEGRERVDLDGIEIVDRSQSDDLVALDDALSLLAREDSQTAELVKLRYFAGMSNKQAAEVLGISPRTADFRWAFARAWLLDKIEGESRDRLAAGPASPSPC